MPSLSSPWFQQKKSEGTSSATRPKAPSSMSVEEQEALSARLSKPTESARQRRALFWKMEGFMDTGRHSWNKMELFEDCKKCMWSPSGAIKRESCKIRPTKMVPNKPRPAPGV
ncbi:hypothetical protein ACOMHN_034999 [Nucella lapillus]